MESKTGVAKFWSGAAEETAGNHGMNSYVHDMPEITYCHNNPHHYHNNSHENSNTYSEHFSGNFKPENFGAFNNGFPEKNFFASIAIRLIIFFALFSVLFLSVYGLNVNANTITGKATGAVSSPVLSISNKGGSTIDNSHTGHGKEHGASHGTSDSHSQDSVDGHASWGAGNDSGKSSNADSPSGEALSGPDISTDAGATSAGDPPVDGSAMGGSSLPPSHHGNGGGINGGTRDQNNAVHFMVGQNPDGEGMGSVVPVTISTDGGTNLPFADSISIIVDGKDQAIVCTNCSSFRELLSLPPGNHTLAAEAIQHSGGLPGQGLSNSNITITFTGDVSPLNASLQNETPHLMAPVDPQLPDNGTTQADGVLPKQHNPDKDSAGTMPGKSPTAGAVNRLAIAGGENDATGSNASRHASDSSGHGGLLVPGGIQLSPIESMLHNLLGPGIYLDLENMNSDKYLPFPGSVVWSSGNYSAGKKVYHAGSQRAWK